MQVTKSRGPTALTALTVLMVAGVAGLAMAGCARSTAIPAARHDGGGAPVTTITSPVRATVHVPKGWKTYTDGRVAIAVPGTWEVKRDSNCPDATAPGALLLGFPTPLEYCPAYRSTVSYVALIVPPAAAGTGSWSVARETPDMIHGVEVYPGFGSPAALQWMAPSLGIEIIGTGPLADSIVSTLHRS
jgi:hypothetical protein